ncbi:MAG: ATPase domain-containing protein [Desulfuromonadales bacterium]
MKSKTVFTCQQCGYQSPKWLGKCPDCNEWNTLVEETLIGKVPKRGTSSSPDGGRPQRLAEVSATEEDRHRCGIGEFDRVLGGGLVPGAFTLIGGDPGIGKSTLLLQAVSRLAGKGCVLYVSAEESLRQVKLRAARLGVSADELFLLAETSLDVIRQRVRDLKPDFLVVDSIRLVMKVILILCARCPPDSFF